MQIAHFWGTENKSISIDDILIKELYIKEKCRSNFIKSGGKTILNVSVGIIYLEISGIDQGQWLSNGDSIQVPENQYWRDTAIEDCFVSILFTNTKEDLIETLETGGELSEEDFNKILREY